MAFARVATAFLLLSVAGCREHPREVRVVVVTATPQPTVAVTSSIENPAVTPADQHAEFSFPIVEPSEAPFPAPTAATGDSASEPRREATPDSLHQQMEKCLTFNAQRTMQSYAGATVMEVTARNSCGLSFAGDEVWFEIRAVPVSGGGTAARELGRFQTPIPAFGSAETVIALGVSSGPFHNFPVSLWWAAGGGRKPE